MKENPAQAEAIKARLNSHNKARFECIKDDFVNQTDKEGQLYTKPRSKELVKYIYLNYPFLINPPRESSHPEISELKQSIYLDKYTKSPFENLEKNRLVRIINDLMVDQVFKCYTRQALPLIWEKSSQDVKWLVFFDIDDLHDLNARIGYDNADKKIAAALKMRHDGSLIVRWYSGDEFLVLGMSGDYEGFIERIKHDFASHGLSATFAGCNKKGSDYKAQLNSLIDKVSADKANKTAGHLAL